MRALAVAAIVIAWTMPAEAADVNADPSNYLNLLQGLGPGDRLILAAGEYAGLPISGLDGTEQSPIVITGPETGAPAIITGRACCNTISIRNSSHLVIRHLDVDARGELVDGVKAEGDAAFAHHITIEHSSFYGFGQDQQIVGINTKCPSWDWTIRYNVIRDAGTGIYLGGSTGGEPFVRGTIEYNLVVDPIGYGMQIKHQNDRPAGLGLPANAVTVIRHNVFTKASNASTGDFARPNLLVGHFPPSGDGANDRYEIYGNFFYENASGTEALFQGEGSFTFHDNILVNTFGTAMYVQPQNGEVKDVDIYHNTFLVAGSAVEIYGGTGYTQQVVGNAIFSGVGSPLTGGAQRDNITEPTANAGAFVNDSSAMLGMLDLFPSGSSLSGAPIDLSSFAGDLDGDRDFNGSGRDAIWRGAYQGSGVNPGWMLGEEIKVLMPDNNPLPDAGTLIDGGNTPIDAGFDDAGIPIDAGISIDAGFDDAGNPIDSGMTADTDSGVSKDSGRPGNTNRRTSGGCACMLHRASQSSSLWILVLAIPFLRKRLRQKSRVCL